MIAMASSVRTLSPFAVVLAAIMGFGLMLAFPYASDMLGDVYDATRPVVTASAKLMSRDKDEVWVSMRVTKHRDCERLGIYAYSYLPNGEAVRATVTRPGVVDMGYVDAGMTIVGDWRIYPTTDATKVSVHMTHRCADRVVATRLLEVTL